MAGPPATAFVDSSPEETQVIDPAMEEYQRQLEEYNRQMAEYEAWQASQGSQSSQGTQSSQGSQGLQGRKGRDPTATIGHRFATGST